MNTTTKKEMFDIHRAMYIKAHWDELKHEIVPFCKGTMSIEGMKKQFDSFVSGFEMISDDVAVRQVNYRQKYNDQGRLFADFAVSSQGIARPIRHSIVDGLYVDVDIVNAHPNILLQMLEADGVDCPNLRDYCANRPMHLKTLTDQGMSKDQAKAAYLKIVNKGPHKLDERMPMFAHQLSNEMVVAQRHFCDKKNEEFKQFVAYRTKAETDKCAKQGKQFDGTVWNIQAKWMNFLICDNENKALNGIRKAFNDDERIVLCFDGAMIPKDIHDALIKDGDYDRVQASIMNESGFDLEISSKPFDLHISCFKDPAFIVPKYVKREPKLYNDFFTEFRGRDNKLEDILKWAKQCIFVVVSKGKKKLVRKKSNIQRFGKAIQENTFMDVMDYQGALADMDDEINILNPKHNPLDPKSEKYLYNTLGDFIKKMCAKGDIETFKAMNFSPHLGNPKVVPESLNMFTEFPHLASRPTEGFKFEESLFYAHLRDVICDGDKMSLDHLIGSWADIIQDPLILKRNAQFISGSQATGKSLIAAFLMNVLGHENVAIVEDIDRYFEKFNEDIMFKLMLIFEELPEDSVLGKKYSEKLKTHVTTPKVTIEYKNGGRFPVDRCSRYMFLANNYHGAFQAVGDTRISMRLVKKNNLAGKKEYFVPLWNEVNDKQFSINCFHYLMNLRYDHDLVSECFTTAEKQDMKVEQMKTGYKFIRNLLEDRFSQEAFSSWKEAKPNDKMFRFPMPELNTAFQTEWKVGGNETLSRQLKDLGLKIASSKTNAYNTGKQCDCVTLYPLTVQELISKAIEVPTFKLRLDPPEDEIEEIEPKKEVNYEELLAQLATFKLQTERAEKKLAEYELRIRSPEPNHAS